MEIGSVLPVHQPVSRQSASVESSGLVEPPVLGDAQAGVPGALVPGILLAGAF